ncbi:MAG TPA: aconitate hydratase AcnA [Pirellulales bacterium]|jgi:aconitate hydratase|nr:aconitate hydratase AcnA [Pirellulales bacterium]
MSNAARKSNSFGAREMFETGAGKAALYRLTKLEELGLARIAELPFSIRVLLESALRNCDGFEVTEEHVKHLAGWKPTEPEPVEIPFKPARVLLQDFTGVPLVVDLAAMRGAMKRLGGDPRRINPLIPVDLVIDHSVQVDYFATTGALDQNVELEFERNGERYEFLRWGQNAFDNFRVVPPAVGICHQVNLEYLAKGVFLRPDAQGPVALPDSLVGTDSHTTMINGLGVVGWGVGGIEAEAVMLGQPLYMLMPEVVGFEITGQLPAGATATDLVLTVTQILRKQGVVSKFVEFFGPGVSKMKVADRATIGNMAPEYGATMGFFPIDAETLEYLRRTGRSEAEVQLVERYTKQQQLFRTDDGPTPKFTKVLSLDLGSIEPSLAGPKRPQDRVPLKGMKESFRKALRAPLADRGFALDEAGVARTGKVVNGDTRSIGHGAVVIAAITSCTNTSNPSVMLAAGLLAKKAVEKGLHVASYVKTSIAPGSRVVTDYLEKAGLTGALDKLGFNIVGYGCTTCIGNSGPLPAPVAKAVTDGDLVAAAVLSGNRNFEGRVNPLVRANYLASPPLVVAYALAGTTDIDLTTEPLGSGSDGRPVFLKDIWPTQAEVHQTVEKFVLPEMFRNRYHDVFSANEQWNKIVTTEGDLYEWDSASTYIQEPPYLANLSRKPGQIRPITGARVLLALGDSVTTDHISPAGSIAASSPAGLFLQQHGVQPLDFNSYGARRGNDRVMTRGTFANIRIRNQVAPGTEGGVTRHLPDGKQMSVFDAAAKYQEDGVPLVVLAGAEYGTGSSRDWAAKGTFLLGVRAVLAVSFERIHRSNLVGMGVLPLELPEGKTWRDLGLTGEEVFDVVGLDDSLQPAAQLTVRAKAADGTSKEFVCRARIDTPVELEYYRNGGILQTVLRKLLDNPTG